MIHPPASATKHFCDPTITVTAVLLLPARSSHAPDEVHPLEPVADDAVLIVAGPEHDRLVSVRLDSFPDCHAHAARLCDVSPGSEVSRRGFTKNGLVQFSLRHKLLQTGHSHAQAPSIAGGPPVDDERTGERAEGPFCYVGFCESSCDASSFNFSMTDFRSS